MDPNRALLYETVSLLPSVCSLQSQLNVNLDYIISKYDVPFFV
jgi:hypothetical protein